MSFTSNSVSYSVLLVCKDKERKRNKIEREIRQAVIVWGASQAMLLCGGDNLSTYKHWKMNAFPMQRTKERSQVSSPTNELSVRCSVWIWWKNTLGTVWFNGDHSVPLFASKNHQNGLSFLGPGHLLCLCLSTCLIMEDNRPINGI